MPGVYSPPEAEAEPEAATEEEAELQPVRSTSSDSAHSRSSGNLQKAFAGDLIHDKGSFLFCSTRGAQAHGTSFDNNLTQRSRLVF